MRSRFEPQPLAGAFAAACRAAGLPLLTAYNLFLLLCLTLNGCASAALLRSVGLGGLARRRAGRQGTLPWRGEGSAGAGRSDARSPRAVHASLRAALRRAPAGRDPPGFFPESFLRLKAAMKGFPDVRSVEALAERDVRWVVVPTFVASREAVEAPALDGRRLRWSFGDVANGIEEYALEAVAP